MKAFFEQPEIGLERFLAEDIVTASGGIDLPIMPIDDPNAVSASNGSAIGE